MNRFALNRTDFMIIVEQYTCISNSTAACWSSRVVRWCWVNFQCPYVRLIWIKVGQRPLRLQKVWVGLFGHFFSCIISKSFFKHRISHRHGWMDDLRFYVLFNSISVMSGRWEVDNERLCAMELHLRLRRFCLERGSNSVRWFSRPALNPLSIRGSFSHR